ncbi:thiamine pyrophosphate-dependent enzyme, partial [Kitasatospora nipponensis]|uniref:thiamine pyrophosphate-dependent enzyme n=1 Tax=Kitasatospora nipponensis TaxID=258049 RepID=UPI0031E26F22
ENNGYATTLPAHTAVAGSATGLAAAFGIPAVTVDGMDVEAVRAATAEAVGRARAGGGPSFLECLTYRFEGHHTMERRMKLSYRSAAELAAWQARDPLEALRPGLPRAAQIDAEVAEQLAAAAEFALAGEVPPVAQADRYLYATGLRPRPGWDAQAPVVATAGAGEGAR